MISSVLMKMSSVHENLPEHGHWANQKKERSCLGMRKWGLGKSQISKITWAMWVVCHLAFRGYWRKRGPWMIPEPTSSMETHSFLKCFLEWLLNHSRTMPVNTQEKECHVLCKPCVCFCLCLDLPSSHLVLLQKIVSDSFPLFWMQTLLQDAKSPRIRWAV